MTGMHASPSIFNAWNSGPGREIPASEKRIPMIMAIIMGLARSLKNEAWTPFPSVSTILMPTEKYTMLPAINIATAGARPVAPKASTASGSPMLPELLYIMGGTKLRLS